MPQIWFHEAILLDPESTQEEPGCLLVENGKLVGRFPAEATPPEGALAVSLSGCAIAPGFLDLHFHGRLIFTPPGEAKAELARAARAMPHSGVTGFLPTTIAWDPVNLRAQVSAWAEASAEAAQPDEAAQLGLHLEGPWIRPEAAGAQPKSGIRPFAAAEGLELLDRGEGRIRMVTLAPEAPGSADLLAALGARGIVASLGHSHADADTSSRAIDAGARHATHLFNAMGPLHHRSLGLAGVALTDDRLSCDLICDGVHVDPGMVRLAARAKRGRLSLITDRVEPNHDATDDAPGARHSATMPGLYDDGSALRLSDGRLAGSNLTLDRAVRIAVQFGAMTRLEAIQAVTLHPARVLGIEAERGTLRAGARADLVVLDEAGLVRETWIGGRKL